MASSWGSSWSSSWGNSWGVLSGAISGSGTPVIAAITASGSGTVTITGSGANTPSIPAITGSGTDSTLYVGTLTGSILYRKLYDEWADESGLGSQYNINDHAYAVLSTKTGLDLQLDDMMFYFLTVNKGLTGDNLNDLLEKWDLTW